MTSARDLGETTLSMLRGEQGRQVKELDRLIEWLARDSEKPDVIILSNILLGGLAAALKQRLGVPVVCLLQDEKAFVDGLTGPHAEAAWELLRTCCREMNALVAVSRTYGDRVAPQLDLDEDRLHAIYMGIDIEAYQTANYPPERPTIGFLSRMCPERGLDILVETFILLKQNPALASCQLQISGGKSQADEPFLRDIQSRLAQAGVAEDAAYGLCVMEALATGVPVVQPAIGVFPEMLALTGGGVLVEEPSPASFAAALEPLLLDPDGARRLGQQGREGMKTHFDVEKTGADLISLLQKVVREGLAH
jgi:glycosyltransferase involved in cell wall biosynthesis